MLYCPFYEDSHSYMLNAGHSAFNQFNEQTESQEIAVLTGTST